MQYPSDTRKFCQQIKGNHLHVGAVGGPIQGFEVPTGSVEPRVGIQAAGYVPQDLEDCKDSQIRLSKTVSKLFNACTEQSRSLLDDAR